MKRIITNKTAIAICLVFLITVSLAACLGGNKDDTEGVESTTTPGTTTPPTTTTPPSGGDVGLAVPDDYWYTGISSGFSYMSLVFYPNGEFEYKVHFYTSLTDYTGSLTGGTTMSDGIYIYNGTYKTSNGILTLTFTSAQNGDEDSGMRSTALPATHSVPYEIFEDRYEEHDYWGQTTEIRVYHKLKLIDPLPPLSSMPDVIEELYKDGLTLYLYNENDRGGSILNVPEPDTFSWTGRWESDWDYTGNFDLIQNGNTVTGTCALGSFSGTVSGNTLIITEDLGRFSQLRFTMSPDGSKFSMEEMSSSWLLLNTVAVRVP